MTILPDIRIVAFGDSITQALSGEIPEQNRWPFMLGKILPLAVPCHQFHVINSGIGGNTSREGLARFEADVAAHAPDIVLVEFGGNDATDDPDRHVPLDEYEQNVIEIHARSRALGAEAYFLTFPPVIERWHSWYKKEVSTFTQAGGQDEFIELYRQRTRVVAARLGAPLIDIDAALRQVIREKGAASQILPDGVHLTAGGNRTVLAMVFAEVLKHMTPA